MDATAAGEDVLAPGESEELAEAAGRGRTADRALATAVGQEHRTLELGPSYVAALARRQPQLRPEQELELVLAAKAGDEQARAKLVEVYLPRILAQARHYRASPAIDRLELLQEGVVGLLEALARYEPERGIPFWAYARWYVRRNMQRLVAELGSAVVLSDHALRQLSAIRDAGDRFVAEHHRDPAPSELAEMTGLSREDVARLLLATRPPAAAQQTVTFEDGSTVSYEAIADELAEGEYERVLDAVEAEELASLLSTLSERERTILRWRYGLEGEELDAEEIARRLGLSTRRVREIERQARAKLAAAATRAQGARS
jgi:RNA polymerase sigma factor (sigma-70 family)